MISPSKPPQHSLSRTELKNMRGGTKHMYLRLHREEILAFYEKNGERATLKQYRMRPQTFNDLLNNTPEFTVKFSQADKAIEIARIALASNNELRNEIQEMKREYSQFVNLISQQIVARVIKALQTVELDIPPEFETRPDIDPLSLAGLDIKKLKRGSMHAKRR